MPPRGRATDSSRVMRTRPLRRVAAAILNLLFLLAWGEPAALHPCPMHDGVVATTTAAASVTGHHHAMAPAESHEHGAPHEAHVCSCLGHCAVSVGVAAPALQRVRWGVIVRRRAVSVEAETAAPLAAAPRLLPFANGPPRTA